MSTIRYLPSLGMRGRWQLAEPYRDLIVSTALYTCDSITRLAAAVANNEDPLNTLYLAIGDTQERYNADLANDDYLVTISSPSGESVTFPRSALTAVPGTDGVEYQTTVATLALGVLPSGFDFTAFESKLKALVVANLGVQSHIYFQSVGTPMLLTYEQATTLSAARTAAITDPESLQNRLDAVTAQNTALKQQMDLLEAYVALHFGDITPP